MTKFELGTKVWFEMHPHTWRIGEVRGEFGGIVEVLYRGRYYTRAGRQGA